jgi:hypothetical protein
MTIRNLGSGILKKDTTIHNHIYHFKLERGTKVLFGFDSQTKTPVVEFEKQPLVCRRIAHKWYVTAWEKTLPIVFPGGGEPYPFSYVQHGTAMN